MYDKNMDYEVRPKQEVKNDNFSKAITTRLMVKRLSGSEERRKSSLNFPPGSFIPNTNTLLKQSGPENDDEETSSNTASQVTVSNLKDCKVENSGKLSASETAETPETPLQKMRESVRRRSRSNSSSVGSRRLSSQSDSEKSERRVSMRTSKLEVTEVRRPSPDSLRRSIDNSDQEVELLDLDELVDLERRGSKSRSTSSRVSFRRESEHD